MLSLTTLALALCALVSFIQASPAITSGLNQVSVEDSRPDRRAYISDQCDLSAYMSWTPNNMNNQSGWEVLIDVSLPSGKGQLATFKSVLPNDWKTKPQMPSSDMPSYPNFYVTGKTLEYGLEVHFVPADGNQQSNACGSFVFQYANWDPITVASVGNYLTTTNRIDSQVCRVPDAGIPMPCTYDSSLLAVPLPPPQPPTSSAVSVH